MTQQSPERGIVALFIFDMGFLPICYLQSKTFTLVCNPHETVARARAQMLHILFELGRAEHQFRFRFKGEYLRDGYTFEVNKCKK